MLTCVQVPISRQNANAGQGMNGGNQAVQPNAVSAATDYTSTDPPYPLTPSVVEMIDNPLGMSDWGSTYTCDWATGSGFAFFLKCEYFCQKFNMAKANPFYEYDAFKLRTLYEYLTQYEDIFPNGSDTNMFRDDVLTLKKELEELYPKLPYEGLFFISKDDRIDLAKYDSDFTRLSSFNPMALAEGHTLNFKYQSVSIFKLGFTLLIATFLVFKF